MTGQRTEAVSPPHDDATRAAAKAKPDRIAIVMLGSGRGYTAGDVKVIPVDQAERLIRNRHARPKKRR